MSKFNRLFLDGYLECLAWTNEDEPGFSEASFSPDLLAKAEADCDRFQTEQAELLDLAYAEGYTLARAGHDLWLTRNGHGAGYWDRNELAVWIEDRQPKQTIGDALSDAAKAMGQLDAYVGDDGMIYT